MKGRISRALVRVSSTRLSISSSATRVLPALVGAEYTKFSPPAKLNKRVHCFAVEQTKRCITFAEKWIKIHISELGKTCQVYKTMQQKFLLYHISRLLLKNDFRKAKNAKIIFLFHYVPIQLAVIPIIRFVQTFYLKTRQIWGIW